MTNDKRSQRRQINEGHSPSGKGHTPAVQAPPRSKVEGGYQGPTGSGSSTPPTGGSSVKPATNGKK